MIGVQRSPAGFEDQLVSMLPRLRRFARSLTGSAVEAEDIVQTGCIKALRNRDSFTPGTRFDSWLFRILQNTWRDELRRRAVRPEGTSVELDCDVPDEVDRLGDRATLAAVRRAMALLPEEQREALALVSVEGLPYAEAAAILEVPIGTLMSRVSRGRQRLRRLVDGEPVTSEESR
jgi:RNA polymerase sigma-70 factor, ECF subfamily